MAIKSFLHFEGKTYNVLKFDYKLLYETTEEIKKTKVQDFYERYKSRVNFDTEKRMYDEAKEESWGEFETYGDYPMSFEDYMKDQQTEEKTSVEHFYPQTILKGGIINFNILAQPTDFTEFHKWVLKPTMQLGGSFCFTLSVGSEKKYKFVSFSNANCVSLKETFTSQNKEQMILQIKIIAICIRFGENSHFFHEKIDQEEKIFIIQDAKYQELEARKIMKLDIEKFAY